MREVLPTVRYTKEDLQNIRKEIFGAVPLCKERAKDWLLYRNPDFPWDMVKDFEFEFTDDEYQRLRNLAIQKNLNEELVSSLDCNYDVAFWLTDYSLILCNGHRRSGASTSQCWSFAVMNYLYYSYLILASEIESGPKKAYHAQVRAILNPYLIWPERAVARLGIVKRDISSY
jgi:hypothetical protein